jgi:hypothetical protein
LAGGSAANPIVGPNPALDRPDDVGMLWRRILFIGLVPYVLWLVFCYRYHLVDGVNLAAHETGHLVLRPFGMWPHMMGGSIGQMVFPVVFAISFLRRGQRFDAAVCAVWVAESLMYMAAYLGDAQARALPLVGGHLHDWHWMLSRAGLLAHCELIAGTLHVVASLLAIGATCIAAYAVRPGATRPDDHDGDIDPYGDVEMDPGDEPARGWRGAAA